MKKITFLSLIFLSFCAFGAGSRIQAAEPANVTGHYTGTMLMELSNEAGTVLSEDLSFNVTNTGPEYKLVIPEFPVKTLITTLVPVMAEQIIYALGSEVLEYSMVLESGTTENTLILQPEALSLTLSTIGMVVDVDINKPVQVNVNPATASLSYVLVVPKVSVNGFELPSHELPLPITLSIQGTKSESGFTDVQKDGAFRIYPSAGSDYLKVVSGTLIRNYQIISLSGSTVAAAVVNANEKHINISNLPVGVYLLKAETEAGTVVKKFVRK